MVPIKQEKDMPKKLAGKVAIVTGASKGIGASIARHLAQEGAAVAVNYSSSRTEAEKVVQDIVRQGGKAIAIQADMAEQADIARLFDETKKTFGRLDILVNNAGIYIPSSLQEFQVEHFRKMFDINVLGLLLASREAARHFGPEGGSIINISSVVSKSPQANFSVYSATKGAVDAISTALGKELGTRNIRVNSINPGMVETEGLHAAGFSESDFRQHVEHETPLGRIGKPEDIAPAVAFLASDDASWITGETLVISGGFR